MRFLNGWSLAILLLVILPGGGYVTVELLQRHRYTTVAARLDAALRELEAGVRMECRDRSDLRLEVATGVSKQPLRLELKRELRNEDSGWDRAGLWVLSATCARHIPGHGLGMEFRVVQERRYVLRSPRVTMQMNVAIPPSMELPLQRALQGLDVERYYFEY